MFHKRRGPAAAKALGRRSCTCDGRTESASAGIQRRADSCRPGFTDVLATHIGLRTFEPWATILGHLGVDMRVPPMSDVWAAVILWPGN